MPSAQSCPVDSRSDVSEADEFLDDLVESWVEVYKKSATTVFLLRIISKEEELSTAQILTRLSEVSGWSFTGPSNDSSQTTCSQSTPGRESVPVSNAKSSR